MPQFMFMFAFLPIIGVQNTIIYPIRTSSWREKKESFLSNETTQWPGKRGP